MSEHAGPLPSADMTVDASGLKCPLPILRAKKALAQMDSGQILQVVTTDQHAVQDFQAFCAQTGNTLIVQKPTTDGQAMTHYLKRR